MVSAVRKGASLRAVAAQFKVSHSTILFWVRRAEGRRLDRVDFSDRPPRPVRTRRTRAPVEDLVVDLRAQLKDRSALGQYGASAIRDALSVRGVAPLPSVRTVGRILQRRGALDVRRRRRFPAPPRGWYLPAAGDGRAEVDCCDIVEDLRIEGGPLVDVLTGVSLFGRLAAAWPVETPVTACFAAQALPEHWREHGLPDYVQFDNDTRFQGAHHRRNSISRVMRTCLSLGVSVVFAPPQEMGFQASVENFNGQWQRAVWQRHHHGSLRALRERSLAYVGAWRSKHAARIAGVARRRFPQGWALDLQGRPQGTLVYLRRTDADGRATFLGQRFPIDRTWTHRLVRCEVDLTAGRVRAYRLRRREPGDQPLLSEWPFTLPDRPFHE